MKRGRGSNVRSSLDINSPDGYENEEKNNVEVQDTADDSMENRKQYKKIKMTPNDEE